METQIGSLASVMNAIETREESPSRVKWL
jgi:hypothetical protein